ncbi:MAG: mechanosensitive ion channel family protein [Spirochaetia bacterium]
MNIVDFLISWFLEINFSHGTAQFLARTLLLTAIVLMSLIANFITKRFIFSISKRVVKHTKTKWDDIIVEQGVIKRFSHIAPAAVIYFLIPIVFPELDAFSSFIQRLCIAYMIGVSIFILDAVLEAGLEIYETFPISKSRPLKGYAQLLKIFIYIIGTILVVTTILNRSAWGLISGIGAMTAVLLLVFKDSILGLVASVQLSLNNMIQLGDWISMPKYGADGDVIDISLQSIKVQNWDKTITTIPIYALISDSFTNWRGMTESGGRRIKRAINIDMRSISFLDRNMINRFKNYALLKDYIESKEKEVIEYNQSRGFNQTSVTNGRRLTNIGTFRAYIDAYLRDNPNVHTDMTFLVRHLPPGPKGLPIEIYVFSKDQRWAYYEGIQADIFDHLLAILPEFSLRAFQEPSGYDIQDIADALHAPSLKVNK